MVDFIIFYKVMNEQLVMFRGIYIVDVMKGDFYWFFSDCEVYLVRCIVSDFKVERRIFFFMFGNFFIEGLVWMVYDRWNDCFYFCLNNFFVCIVVDSIGLYKLCQKLFLWVLGFLVFDEQMGEWI